MRLRSSKAAEITHTKNMAKIKELIKKFQHPDTTPEERVKIKEKFQAIIDFTNKVTPTDSMFLKLVGKFNSNGNGQH